jgi:hypothetical protein
VNFIDPYGLYSFDEGVQDAANLAAGFGDTLTSGFGLFDKSLTELAREALGSDDVVDKCAGVYTAGKVAGYAWGAAAGGAASARAAGWTVQMGKYPHGGGGLNLLKNGARKFGLDWHKFKLNGKTVNKLHYHLGKTKNQMKKHRPWQTTGRR